MERKREREIKMEFLFGLIFLLVRIWMQKNRLNIVGIIKKKNKEEKIGVSVYTCSYFARVIHMYLAETASEWTSARMRKRQSSEKSIETANAFSVCVCLLGMWKNEQFDNFV